MSHGDWVGWSAAALMVATFACRDARRMRGLAVATNLAFIGYAAVATLPPVMALHLLLLPINLWRWHQIRHDGQHPAPRSPEGDASTPDVVARPFLSPTSLFRRST